MGVFTMILPLLLIYVKYDRDQQHLYGLAPKRFDVKPYFIMLGFMLPLIIAASFLPSFLKQYPMYETSRAHLYMEIPEWMTVAGYEIAYALNFVSIEFFFRGFLIIGMIRVLGRGAVLPMACVYCFLHFGKPMGEAISSIFGGYILGIIAYETRGVWGGVIVHVGIAWLMEFVAYGQKLLSND
jgi:membrane protease YdiL (CAAX protease family)